MDSAAFCSGPLVGLVGETKRLEYKLYLCINVEAIAMPRKHDSHKHSTHKRGSDYSYRTRDNSTHDSRSRSPRSHRTFRPNERHVQSRLGAVRVPSRVRQSDSSLIGLLQHTYLQGLSKVFSFSGARCSSARVRMRTRVESAPYAVSVSTDRKASSAPVSSIPRLRISPQHGLDNRCVLHPCFCSSGYQAGW
jgi:hypothetical protein